MTLQTRNLIRWILIGLYVAGALLFSDHTAARWIVVACLAGASLVLSAAFTYTNRHMQDIRQTFARECVYDILVIVAALFLFDRLIETGV